MSSGAVRVVGRPALTGMPHRAWLAWPLALVAVSVLVLLIAGVLAFSGGSSAPSGAAQAGPTRSVDGLPTSYADTAEGAEAAAARLALVSFGVLDGRVGASPATIADVYATASYRPMLTTLLDETVARREAHAAELGRLTIRRTILATRLVSYAPQRATVETWEFAQAMLGQPPIVSSQVVQRWELAWSASDWHLLGAGTEEGSVAEMIEAQRAEILRAFTGRGDASPGY